MVKKKKGKKKGRKKLLTVSAVRTEIGKVFKKVKGKEAREKAMKRIWGWYHADVEALKKGKGVEHIPAYLKAKKKALNPVKSRPPKKWWDKMLKRISAMKKYREFPVKRKHKIVAGIWHDYSDATKRRLLKRYE